MLFRSGIPVVVTDAGAIAEVVKEFRCGKVVEQRSPKALAAGIRGVLGNYDIYQHGVIKCREEANWKKAAEKHAQVYSETLQEYYEKHGMPESRKAEAEIRGTANDEADIFGESETESTKSS